MVLRYLSEGRFSAVKAEFEQKLQSAKNANNNATRISDKPAIIGTLLDLANLYLEYGDIPNALAVLRNVRSYVSVSSSPGVLYLLKQIQFFAKAEEELAVVPAIYLQSVQGRHG